VIGLFGCAGSDSEKAMDAMCRVVRSHRGLWVEQWENPDRDVAIGRSSLGCFLPSGQPLTHSDGSILFVEGEIPRSDGPESAAKYVSRVFENRGIDGIYDLHAPAMVAHWQPQARRLTLFGDPLGMRSIYYTARPGFLAFASSATVLFSLEARGWVRELDEAGVAQLLAFGMVLDEHTLLRGISRLEGGQLLIWENGVLRIEQREMPIVCEDSTHEESHWEDAYEALLVSALKWRLDFEGSRWVLPLSGGWDSRLLLGLLAHRLSVPLETVTYGLPRTRDARRAAEESHLVGFAHCFLPLPSDYPSRWAVPNLHRTLGQVGVLRSHGISLLQLRGEGNPPPGLLLGNGPDIFLAAIEGRFAPEIREIADRDFVNAYFRHINRHFPTESWAEWLMPSFYRQVKDIPEALVRDALQRTKADSLQHQVDSFDIFHFLISPVRHGLALVDAYLPFTEPYLDWDLVQFMLKVPRSLRWKRELERRVLVRVAPGLARLPGGPLFQPSRFEQRLDWLQRRARWGLRKIGLFHDADLEPPSATFTDMHRLLRRPINRGWVEKTLLSPEFLERGWFRPDAIRKAVSEHMEAKVNHTRVLELMLTLALFATHILDSQAIAASSF